MTTNGIVWEEPPPSGSGSRQRDFDRSRRTVEQLKANPGKWAKIITGVSPSYASALKNGRSRAWRPVSDFEVVSRNSDPSNGMRKVDVYARYIGQVKS